MRTLWLSILKDLRRWSRDPVGIGLWGAIPLAVAILMKLAFGGGSGGLPVVPIVIVDQDESPVSGFLVDALQQGPAAEMLRVQEADSLTAVRALKGGRASAALFLRPGFGQDYLDGRTARIGLMKNPAQSILPSIVEEGSGFLADGGFYLREVFADPMTEIRRAVEDSMGVDDVDASAMAQRIGAAITEDISVIGRYAFPPVIALEPDTDPGAQAGDDGLDFFALFFPGIVMMTLLFIGQPLALDLWEERKNGTLYRSAVAPDGVARLTLGKSVAGAVFLFAISLFLLVFGRWILRIELGSILPAAIFAGVVGFAVVSVLQTLVTLPKTENGATIITSFLIMPLVFLGGSFFPFEAMPPFLRTVGELTPNGMALVELKKILAGNSSAGAMLGAMGICLAVGLVFANLASRRVHRRFLAS